MTEPTSASHWGLHGAAERTPIYAEGDATRQKPLRELTSEERAQVASFKDIGQEFIDLLNTLPLNREIAVAITNMEQAVMWAVKGVTK